MVAKLSSQALRVLRKLCEAKEKIAKLFHLKCFEVYTNFAKLSTLMSVKFVIAKHLRGVR